MASCRKVPRRGFAPPQDDRCASLDVILNGGDSRREGPYVVVRFEYRGQDCHAADC